MRTRNRREEDMMIPGAWRRLLHICGTMKGRKVSEESRLDLAGSLNQLATRGEGLVGRENRRVKRPGDQESRKLRYWHGQNG